MAVAAYTTNLTTLDDCNTDTGYVEPTASGWAQLNAESFAETDLFIQNANSISATAKVGVGATMFNNTTGITLGTNDAVLIWVYWAAPNSLATEASGGIRQIIGATTANFDYVVHGGSDTYLYGGWINVAMGSPAQITTTSVGSGTGTTYQYHGWAFNATAVPSKGNPYVVDCMRYGRCDIVVTAGDITPNGPATFSGMATENDLNVTRFNRWGLFQAISGGYLWKGLMTLGTAGTAVYFVDSNAAINVDNTKNVTAAFNAIEINNTGSTVDWTGVSITALGTVSKGTLNVVDNATVSLTGCAFTDMDAFTFNDGTNPNDITDTIFRRCGLITTGGASFTGCTLDEPSGTIGVTASSPANAALITNSTFNSDGTGNGLEITGTAADLTLTGLTFTGYSLTVDANKAIYVNIATGTVNLTLSGGSGISADSHVRTAGATVNVIVGAVTVQANAVLKAGTAVENARVYLRASNGTGPFPFEETVTSITRATTTATVTHPTHGMASNDKIVLQGITDKTEDNYTVKQITVTGTNTYTYTTTDSGSTSYTGTIKSTFVALNGLTNASGVISLSRVYATNQPVTGWARKSTSSPLLQEGVLVGEVDSADGFNGTAVMLADE